MSHRPILLFVLFAFSLIPAAPAAAAETPVAMPVVTATDVVEAPAWATLERALIVKMNEAAGLYLEHYTRPDGSLYGVGDWDDVYDMFFNWSQFYAIGGSDSLFTWARREYDVLTEYCTRPVPTINFERYHERYFGMLDDGFPECDDWFHIGPGAAASMAHNASKTAGAAAVIRRSIDLSDGPFHIHALHSRW